MLNQSLEKTVKALVLFGAPFATLFILTDTVSDPVNATKLFITGGIGISALLLFLVFGLKKTWRKNRTLLVTLVLFNIFSLISTFSSSSPFAQNFYGAYGRNTGFLTYFLLSCITLAPFLFTEIKSFSFVVKGLQIAGLVNVIYCAWVLAFGDFVSWSNPYGNILGLFGNPDFISAFLGIFVSTCLAFALAKDVMWMWRFAWIAVSLPALFEIKKSHAVQGLVVCAGGVAIVGFFYLRNLTKSKILNASYSLGASILGILAVLGAFQKGPFSYVYKTSVSLRGSYWHAGLKMGLDHPFFGVGMDSFGDWYRRARSLHAATELPGPGTVSNAAHNVVIDIFAYGGFPLLLCYLMLIIFPLIAIARVIKRLRKYDPVFVAMTAAWSCYQVQSIISINQVGLAIWGWLLGGALVAHERLTSENPNSDVNTTVGKQKAKKKSNNVFSPQLVAGVGVVIGLFLASPPLSADTKWRAALESKSGDQILASLKPSFMNPSDPQRYVQAVQIFAQSNLSAQAHSIALTAVDYNPDSFDSWRILYFLSATTPAEKSKALSNMKRLDPLNPDVTKP